MEMKISEVYEKYKIMPQLGLHMLRVTAVASIICDNFQRKIDKENLLTACLLHDIGNIIKFDLTKFPDSLKPKGYKYWKSVQKDYFKKWGNDDHSVTLKICKELKMRPQVINILEVSGFGDTLKIFNSKSIELKIFKYSDLRVRPEGISSLEERLNEAQKRYLQKKNGPYSLQQFNEFIPMWKKIENNIFKYCLIKPEEITEEKVEPLIVNLRNFNITTE